MKKWMKFLGIALGSLLLLVCIGIYVGLNYYKGQFFTASENRITIERNEGGFTFEWSPSNLDGFYEPHGAILFPVNLEGFSGNYYLQWDSGSSTTVFYQKALFSLYESSALPDTIQKGSTPYLKDFHFSIGDNIDLSMDYVKLMDYGKKVNKEDSSSRHILGTIGSDFIDGQVFSMNFKTREVSLYKDRAAYSKLNFEPFDYRGRRLIFPAAIDNKKALLMYDSGSSPFGIITSKNKFEKYADANAEEHVYDINSWGTKIPCHNKSSSVPLLIGGSSIELNRVSYWKWKEGIQSFFMAFSDIKGLMGNKALLNSTLILDTQKAEFAVIKEDS